MAMFEVEAHGRRYELEAPDMASATSALRSFMNGSSGTATPTEIEAPNGGPAAPRVAADNRGSRIFSIELPDGRVLEAEAPDEAAALAGAQQWYAANPAQQPRKGSVQPIDPSEVRQPSLGERVADVFTGGLRTQYPEAPEFHSAVTEAQRAAGNRHSVGGLPSMLSTVTPDPRAQVDILRSQIPDLQEQADAHGNIMLRAPSVGVTDWSYLNRPGISDRDVGEFVAGTAVTAPFMPLFGAGASIPARIATGALAGAAGSVAQDVAASAAGSEQGVDPGRAAVSALVGGVAGPLTPRAPTGRPAPAPTVGQEAVLAGERVGVPVPRAMATDSRAAQMVGGSTRALPFGSPLEAAAENTTQSLGTAAERTAAGYGSAAGPFNAGSAARTAMVDWIRNGSAAVDRRLYGAVDNLVNPNATLPLAETRAAVLTLTHEMQASGGQANRGAIALVLDAIQRPRGLTFRGIQQLRTEIGARISGDIVPEAGTSMPALRRLYEALTVDRNRIVGHAGGQPALNALNRADGVHRLIAQRREQLATIIGASGDVAPERVFERLTAMARGNGREDITRLMQARRAMGPAAWNEVASDAIARLGRAPNGDFSPARFVSEYGRLSPNGRNALFSSTAAGQGGLRQALDDIMALSERYQATMARYANPSGTGRAVTSVAGIFGAISNPLETVAAAIGGYGLAGMLARPASANAVRRYMQAAVQAPTLPGQAGALLIEQAQRQLFEAAEADDIEVQRAPQ